MGEVPVLEGRRQQADAVGRDPHVACRQHGELGGRTRDEQLEVLRWLLFDNHKFTSYFATYRFMKAFGATAPDPAVMAFLKSRIDSAFGIVDKHLAGRRYVRRRRADDRRHVALGLPLLSGRGERLRHRGRFPNLAAWVARLVGSGLGRSVRRAAGRAHRAAPLRRDSTQRLIDDTAIGVVCMRRRRGSSAMRGSGGSSIAARPRSSGVMRLAW